MPFGFGTTELIIVLVLALLVFGPKRLPEIGRTIGRGVREVKSTVGEVEDIKKSTIGQVDELKDTLKVDLGTGTADKKKDAPKAT
jgi:sec-independent protein translocase protein TatA